jgi:hypothetical protein
MGEQEKEKVATPEASTYNGSYTVVNCTGETITTVSVQVATGAGKYPFTAQSLGSGACGGTVKFQAQTGSRDNWSVSFVRNGATYSRQGKQCNFETEDADQTVAITLGRNTFSIVMPNSAPCIQNSY